jgi:transcription initiation factor TFIID subunit 1
VKLLKQKKIKGKENVELLRTPRDVSLRDSGGFTLLEYSEESPILLSNPGMASFVFNYYRKRDEKDTFSPQVRILRVVCWVCS